MNRRYSVTVAFFNAAGHYDQVNLEVVDRLEDQALTKALDQVRREQAGARIYRPGCCAMPMPDGRISRSTDPHAPS